MKRFSGAILLAMMGLALSASFAGAQSPPTIRIVSPGDRRNVSDKHALFTVAISGVAPNDGHYWELWVDGEPIIGLHNGETQAALSFDPTGPHHVKAILYNAQKQPLDAQEILVMAAPVQDLTAQFNQKAMAQVMAVFVVFVVTCLVVAFWISRRSPVQPIPPAANPGES